VSTTSSKEAFMAGSTSRNRNSDGGAARSGREETATTITTAGKR
jgi:hypothetical protein